MGVQPVGISRDSPWTHIAWTQALDLTFGLLSDFNGDAVRAFGITQEFRGFQDVARRSAFLSMRRRRPGAWRLREQASCPTSTTCSQRAGS